MVFFFDNFRGRWFLKRLCLLKESLRSICKLFLLLFRPFISVYYIVELTFLMLHFGIEKFFTNVQCAIPTKNPQITLIKLFVNFNTLCLQKLILKSYCEFIVPHFCLSACILASNQFFRWCLFRKHNFCCSITFILFIQTQACFK